MGKKGTAKSKEKYAAQKLITEVNRKKKRERHLKNHPKDLQTLEVFSNM